MVHSVISPGKSSLCTSISEQRGLLRAPECKKDQIIFFHCKNSTEMYSTSEIPWLWGHWEHTEVIALYARTISCVLTPEKFQIRNLNVGVHCHWNGLRVFQIPHKEKKNEIEPLETCTWSKVWSCWDTNISKDIRRSWFIHWAKATLFSYTSLADVSRILRRLHLTSLWWPTLNSLMCPT